jgi:hypothetical protein
MRKSKKTGEWLCNTHGLKGKDYVAANVWQERVSILYCVYWAADQILKVGLGIDERRHERWVSGGAEVLLLIGGQAKNLNRLEKPLVRHLSSLGYQRPVALNGALEQARNVGTECLSVPTLAEAHELASEALLFARSQGCDLYVADNIAKSDAA